MHVRVVMGCLAWKMEVWVEWGCAGGWVPVDGVRWILRSDRWPRARSNLHCASVERQVRAT